jgi:ribonucleoside-diphosphate reductase alpha chain
MGHIEMMGAIQPFISGAISKTVNMPHEVTADDIADAYLQAWRLGVKALAIYRDGSKTAQALRTDAQKDAPNPADLEAEIQRRVAEAVATAPPRRNRMPRERESITHKFSVGGHEGYITAGKYDDGSVGEIFLTDIGKEGSTMRGMMNAFATSISIALQYGVPLETLVRKFSYMRFEPEGMTTNPEIPFAKSMPDYIMRWLASRFLDAETQEELGILTPAVRARRAAEEAASSHTGDTSLSAAEIQRQAERREDSAPASARPQAVPATTTTKPVPSAPSAGKAPTSALTDTPPVVPVSAARSRFGLDLGPACQQCGGMMQRTGACYTCSSCGFNTGCG